MIRRSARRWLAVLLVGGVAVAGAVIVATWPVTTRQGIDYQVTEHKVPLYLKSFEFVDRSAHYQGLAEAVTAGAADDEARALAVLAWTTRNVREVPDGFPVVDDHIQNIITRGYGTSDQQADVFATLLTYAGVPAFWQICRVQGLENGLVLTFVRIDGAWRMFDVAAGVAFRTPDGRLATLDAVQREPQSIPEALRAADVHGVPYDRFIARLQMPAVPQPLRAELQMPLRRLWHEARAATGLASHTDQ